MQTKLVFMLLLATVSMPQAAAQSVPVVNPSFELFPLPPGIWTTDGEGLFGWDPVPTTFFGVFNATLVFTSIPDGSHTFISNDTPISQLLCQAIVEGATYTLEVDIGWANNTPFGGYTTEILAEGVLLASDVNTATPSSGGWAQSTTVYTSPPGDPHAGKLLTIRLDSLGFETNFDNIRFSTDTPGSGLHGSNYCTPAVDNSSGLPAEIRACGSADVADNNLTLVAFFLPPDQFGYFLASMTSAFVQAPGGSQGNLCLGGQIGRFRKQIQDSGAGGGISIQVDLAHIPTTPAHSVVAGETWNFQAWYRDLGNTSNFTDAVSVTFL